MHDGEFSRFVRGELAHDRAFMHDDDAIREQQHFFEFTRSEEHSASRIGESAHVVMDFSARTNIDSASWLVEQEQPRLNRNPSAEHCFLLISPGKRVHAPL